MFGSGYGYGHIGYFDGGGASDIDNPNNGASYYGSWDGSGGVPYKHYVINSGNGTGGGYDEHLSAIRLLADEYDINFYVCQLQLLKGRSP
jgi:hypothetical protein